MTEQLEGMGAAKVFVVGYGNPLRGDDGVGQEVAQVLARQRHHLPALAGTDVMSTHQLVPEMALDLSRPFRRVRGRG